MSKRTTETEEEIFEEFTPADACLIILVCAKDFEESQLGEKFTLNPRGTLIGNQPECDIQLKITGSSRKALIYYDEEEKLWMIENLVEGTLNRVYLNGILNRFALLTDGDHLQLGKIGSLLGFLQGASIQASLSEVLNKRIDEEKKRADTDKLTQTSNRHALDRIIREQVEQCHISEIPLSAIFLDIDHFKHINDTYLHIGGNAVLVALCEKIVEQIRPWDTFARYGGEEFVILLKDASYKQAMGFAERIRKIIEEMIVEHEDHEIKVTVSLGVATLESGWSGEQLIEAANRCLHTAKKTGRNQVIGHQK